MKYRREIDGLRAIAVVPVVLFHAGVAGFGGGYVGVDVFFVISGFLITTILLDELSTGQYSLVRFYERRVRRIFPALCATMMASCVAAAYLLLPTEMREFAQSVASVTLFASNVLFWLKSGYFDVASETKPLLHTWSLAVEEQYYLLFPPLLAALWPGRRRLAAGVFTLLALVSLGWAAQGVARGSAAAFFLLPSRAWELLFGSGMAFALRGRRASWSSSSWRDALAWIGLALILVPVFAYDRQTPFPGLAAIPPVLGAGLVIMCGQSDRAAGKALGSPIFVGIGLVSYSAYLWHQPLLAFWRLGHWGEPEMPERLGLVAMTFVLAWLSWQFVEKPFRSPGAVSRKAVFSWFGVASVGFLGLALWGHVDGGRLGREMRSPHPRGYLESLRSEAENVVGIDGEPCVSEGASMCQVNEGSAQKGRWLLVGDSHSADFSRVYRSFAQARGVQAWQMSVAGCGLIPAHFPRHNGECGAARRALDARLRSGAFDMVLLVGNYHDHLGVLTGDDLLRNVESIKDLLQDAVGGGATVVFVAPRPYFPVSPPRAAWIGQLDRLRPTTLPAHRVFDEGIRSLRGLPRLHVVEQAQVLAAAGCGRVDCFDGHGSDGAPLYRDTNHLSRLGVDRVFEGVTRVVEEATAANR